MSRVLAAASLALFALLLTPGARADVCAPSAANAGPLPVGFAGASFGVPRRACPRTELALAIGGQAIVEPENFYGNIHGQGLVSGSLMLSERLELFGALEPVMYRNVISSVAASHVGLGHTTLGGTYLVLDLPAVVVGATVSTTLPTALGYYKNAFPVGLEAGFLLTVAPLERVRLHGQLSGLGSASLTQGDPLPRAGILASGAAELLPFDWLSLAFELRTQSLYAADLDFLAGGLGVRARLWEGLSLELGVLVPFAGRERWVGAADLAVRYRFE